MAIRRCPYCKAIIDESQKYCNNCGTQLLFPEDEPGEEPIKGEKIVDADFPGDGSDRLSVDDVDSLRDDIDLDVEAEEEGEEIDLEKVIDGEVALPDNTADDLGLIDLREAEPENKTPGRRSEDISIEKPATVEDVSPPDIHRPEASVGEEPKASRSGRSLARRRKEDFDIGLKNEIEPGRPKEKEKPANLTPLRREGSPPSKMRSDQDTKFQIARLIADFEKKRREYTTDLEASAPEVDDKAGEEVLAPPTEAEIGEPPKPEDLEKAADALRTGTEGDFATDYEFETEKKASESDGPESLEDRLSRLVGGFNSAVESVAAPGDDSESDTRHPEFMTGDLSEQKESREIEEPPSPPAAFVTEDFEEPPGAEDPPLPEPGPIEDRDRDVQAARRDFLVDARPPDPPPSEPPAPLPGVGRSDERATLIARILQQRAERLGRTADPKVSKETSDALAALKTSNAAEQAKTKETEFTLESAAPAGTGEIRKPEELDEPEESDEIVEPEEGLLPVEPSDEAEESGEFRAEAWTTPSEELPSLPTMGIPEALPKTPPPLSFDEPVDDLADESAQEPVEEAELSMPASPPIPPTPPVQPAVRRTARRPPEVQVPPPSPPPPPPVQIPMDEPDEVEEPQAVAAPVPAASAARAVEEELDEQIKPPVMAPVVRLGFFRRIKATIFDLLVIGAFWAGATFLTAYFLSMPVLDLIKVSALPLGLLFIVLLVIYFFMFMLFLGETPGGRLVTPKE